MKQSLKSQIGMKKTVPIILTCLVLIACAPAEIVQVARSAVTGDAASAGRLVARKAVRYALAPERLNRDLERMQKVIDAFRKAVGEGWGKDEAREPSPREYVKYIQNYRSRATVDFTHGLITVETIDETAPLASLKKAIVTTLLTPDDPRAVDLYSARSVTLGETPFLLGEVKDFDGEDIRWAWRAERFADGLIKRNLTQRTVTVEKANRTVYRVTIPMVTDHQDVRIRKYRPLVERYAAAYMLDRNLVYAIINTESGFNPYAISRSQALGLMQIMPSTAGRDIHRLLEGLDGIPSREFLLNAAHNIEYGCAYLRILISRHLKGIDDPLSLEYCTIAAYNAGAGEVLRTFDADRNRAPLVINGLAPLEVYTRITDEIPKEEARRYLSKVLNAKKDFVNF